MVGGTTDRARWSRSPTHPAAARFARVASIPTPDRSRPRRIAGSSALGRVVGLRVDAGFLALLRRDGGRGAGERVLATARLGEGDDLTDRRGAGQQRAHAVPAEGDAAVRRSSVAQTLQQEAELLLR